MIPPFLLSLLINKYTIGAVIGIGLLVGAYAKGHHDAAMACHDAEKQAEIDSLKRDVEINAKSSKILGRLTQKLGQDNQDLQQKVTDYATELALHPELSHCKLDGADLKRLRNIGR